MHRCCCQGAVTEAEGKPPHIRTGMESERSRLCVPARTVYTWASVKTWRSLVLRPVINAFASAVCSLTLGLLCGTVAEGSGL